MTAYKSKYMKSIFYNSFVVVIIAGLLAACSAGSSDDDKKGRLEKLKSQQADIVKEIQKLESEIAKEHSEAKPISVIDLRFGNKIFYR